MYNQKAYFSICSGLSNRNMKIYWLDFLSTYALFIAGVFLAITQAGLLSIIGIVIGALAAYRCGSFMHEVVHFSPQERQQQRFRYGWNILFGIPFITASILYMSHLEHHRTSNFGTKNDPEYLPIKNRSYANLLKFIVSDVLTPPTLVILRTFLRPLLWISPQLRSFMGDRGSALIINSAYTPTRSVKPDMFDKIAMTFSSLLLYLYLTVIFTGLIPLLVALKIFAVIFISLFINGVRTLVAHRFNNHSLETLDKEAQLLDSINIVTTPLAGILFAPVGLRFHALHHMLPTLPYHDLAEAHARLMKALPADDTYHAVNIPTILQAFVELRQEGNAPREHAKGAIASYKN